MSPRTPSKYRFGTTAPRPRVAVVTRQLKRARIRQQAMKLAEDRGLTRRQAKRNRARTKAETKRERREGGAP